MAQTDMKPAQRRFAQCLLTSRSITEAAEKAKIPERTARRWMADTSFRAQLAGMESDMWSDATRRLVGLLSPALTVLGVVMADPHTPAGTRVAAAGRIIDSALKLAELRDVQARIAALEAQVAGGAVGDNSPSIILDM